MSLDPKNCKPGGEQHEEFWSYIKKRNMIQYDYRNSNGELFSCLANDLDEARKKRDTWAEINGM